MVRKPVLNNTSTDNMPTLADDVKNEYTVITMNNTGVILYWFGNFNSINHQHHIPLARSRYVDVQFAC